jgi:hypothetical protein
VSGDITRVEKPWGYELHWAKTDRYVGKLIHVNAGHALSLQYHNQKDETIYLHAGKLLFEMWSAWRIATAAKTRSAALQGCRERPLGWPEGLRNGLRIPHSALFRTECRRR